MRGILFHSFSVYLSLHSWISDEGDRKCMFLPDPDAAFIKEQGKTKIWGEPNFDEHAMCKSQSDLRFSLVMTT